MIKDPYDDLVSASPQGSLFCRKWWLEAVAPGRHRILEVRRDRELVAAWPLVEEINGGGRNCVMPPLTQKLGILFRPSSAKYAESLSHQHEATNCLIDQLPEYARFEHRFHENFTNWLPFYWKNFHQTTRYTYLLPDLSSEEALWQEARPECRKNIRKARKQGLRILEDFPVEDFINLHRLTFQRQAKAAPFDDEVIRRIDLACAQRGQRQVLAAADGRNRVHAAIWFAWDGGTAYYLMMGSEPELRQSGAQKLLLWEAVQRSRAFASRFDFEGSMLPSVEKNFRGYGSRQTPYFVIYKDYRTASPASPALPAAGLAQRAGRRIRRSWRVLLGRE